MTTYAAPVVAWRGQQDDERPLVVLLHGRGSNEADIVTLADRRGRRLRLVRQAADLEDTSVTAFVLDTVTSRAKRVVKQHRDLVLSNEAFDRFLAELDSTAQPVPALVELFRENPKLAEA